MTTPSRDVFEILVREHADMLEAFLRSILRDQADVDDVFQETMLVAWRRLDDFDRKRPFGAWLRGIARRLVLERWRKHAIQPHTTDPGVLAEVERQFDLLTARQGDTFLDPAERLLDCLAKLPAHMRDVIDLVYGRGITIVAASVSLGDSEEAVKKRMQRARALLARCLELGDSHDGRKTGC